jgi:hypothetical protein
MRHDLPAAARFVQETLEQEGVGNVAVVLLHSYATQDAASKLDSDRRARLLRLLAPVRCVLIHASLLNGSG